jgi:tetratricopeptide (TPR) repeat protein
MARIDGAQPKAGGLVLLVALIALITLGAEYIAINRVTSQSIDNLLTQAQAAREEDRLDRATQLTWQAALLTTFDWPARDLVLIAQAENALAADDPAHAFRIQQSRVDPENPQFETLKETATTTARRAAAAHLEATNYEQAIVLGQKSDLPETAQDHLLLGRAYLRLIDFTQATAQLRQAVELNPQDTEPQFYLALSLLETDPDQAKELLQENELGSTTLEQIQDLTANSSDLFKSVILAQAFNRINEPETALHFAEAALDIDNKYRDAWLSLAESQLLLKNYSQAKQSARKAIDLDPTLKYAFQLLAKIEAAQGDSIEAQDYSDQAEKLD